MGMTMTRSTKRRIKYEIKGAMAGRGLEIKGLNSREARIAAVGHPYGDLAFTIMNQAAMGRTRGARSVESKRELGVLKRKARRR